MLRQNFKLTEKLSDYADQMNITISHLNDTIRSVTGFTVTCYIPTRTDERSATSVYILLTSVKRNR